MNNKVIHIKRSTLKALINEQVSDDRLMHAELSALELFNRLFPIFEEDVIREKRTAAENQYTIMSNKIVDQLMADGYNWEEITHAMNSIKKTHGNRIRYLLDVE